MGLPSAPILILTHDLGDGRVLATGLYHPGCEAEAGTVEEARKLVYDKAVALEHQERLDARAAKAEALATENESVNFGR